MIMNLGKKIVCVKDIPSNIIEEAIFILKSNVVDNKNSKLEIRTKEIILSEAEEIVDEYIDKIQQKKNERNQNISQRNKQMKKEIIYIVGLFIIACVCISLVI
jgi:hypothetical protein